MPILFSVALVAASAYGAYRFYKRGNTNGMWSLLFLAFVCVLVATGVIPQ